MAIRFDDFELDLTLPRLTRNGVEVDAQRKALEVLSYLVTHRDRVVPAAELFEELWRGSTVTEGSLTRAVLAARRAVDDDGATQRLVRTVRGRGYQFVGEQVQTDRDVAPAMHRPSTAKGRGYVGQRELQGDLTNILDELREGTGAAVLFSGEPGIGKSRGAQEWLAAARRVGVEAHTAWCHGGSEAGAPPFHVWIQLVREITRARSASKVRSYAGTRAPELAAFFPAIAEALPEVRPRTLEVGEGLPYSVFQALGEFLRAAVRDKPLLLLIEDLHWSDRGSTAAFEFLAHEVGAAPLLLAATFRTQESQQLPYLAGSIDRVRRLDRCLYFEVRSLVASEVAELLQDSAPEFATPRISEIMTARTHGNPLFVEEILRNLDPREFKDDPVLLERAIPRGLRSLVRQRISQLEAPAPSLLQAAAVIGGGFDADVLARVAALDVDETEHALHRAVSVHILSAREGTGTRYRFAHDLMREAIYEDLSPLHRARLHQSVAHTCEALQRSLAGDHTELLAHHFFEASICGESAKAVRYAAEAGMAASAANASDRASRHFHRAIALIDSDGVEVAPRDRIEWLLLCAHADYSLGDFDKAFGLATEALDLSRSIGEPRLIARSALRLAGDRSPVPGPDPTKQNALVDALKILDESAPAGMELVPLLLARLAAEQDLHASGDQLRALRLEALDRARSLPEVRSLGRIILTHFAHVLWALPFEARIGIANECLERSQREQDGFSEVAARRVRLEHFVESGQFQHLDEEIDAVESLAHAGEDPRIEFAMQSLRTSRAIARGEFDLAYQSLQQSADLGRKYHVQGAENYFGLQLVDLRTQQGRFEEVLAPLAPFAQVMIPEASYYARALAETGELGEARAILSETLAKLPGRLDDPTSFVACPGLTRAAALCSDQAHALELLPRVAQFRGHIFHRAMWGIFGPAEFYMGLLTATLDRFDEALELYDTAMKRSESLHARAWLAEIHVSKAQVHLRRGDPKDSDEAFALAGKALELANELGQASVLNRAESMLAEISG